MEHISNLSRPDFSLFKQLDPSLHADKTCIGAGGKGWKPTLLASRSTK